VIFEPISCRISETVRDGLGYY